MAKSKIEWTNKSWNPVTGCTQISEGCRHCYAKTMSKRLKAMGLKKYENEFNLTLHPECLEEPLHWKKPCMVFVCSMSDLFHEDVPSSFIDKIFFKAGECKQHVFQILTKRIKRAEEYFGQYNNFLNENEWIGTSISKQPDANKNIPLLLQIMAKVRWLSIEPILDWINIEPYLKDLSNYADEEKQPQAKGIQWVVVGAESGPKRRECKIELIESVVDQCNIANVPVFVKQIHINGKVEKDINKFPKHLQIREFPK